MSKPLRLDIVDGWYHAMSRGLERRELFTDDRDRSHFVGLLEECVVRHGVRLYAYVLMSNHHHLLLETPNANLSRALQWLNVAYVVWFNRRHAFRERHGDDGRDMALRRGRRHCGLTLGELGVAVGNASAAVGAAVRRMERLRCANAGIRRRLAQAEAHLTDNET